MLRRVLALALVLLAAGLALRPTPQHSLATVPMLVAAHDLAPGTTLTQADITVAEVPPRLRPPAALTTPPEATGRVLAGPTTAGEPLTQTRLVSHENSRLSTGDPTAAAVPFRLADPAVAALLTPGTRVDVVTVSADSDPTLLTENAAVLTVRAADPKSEDHLVVLALPRKEATKVAAASLAQPVAVTLR